MKFRTRVVLAVAALSALGIVLPGRAAEPSGPYRPINVSGRIVTEDGQGVAGVRFMLAPQPGYLGLPEAQLFLGVPARCFSYPESGSVITDASGRYRFSARFHPEEANPLTGQKCSVHASKLRRENLVLVPLPTAQYGFEPLTGPMPVPRVNLPAGAKPPRRLPQGTIDTRGLRPR